MRAFGLPVASLLLSAVAAQDEFDFSKCSTENADVDKCAQQIDNVVAVTPGISYFTKIACKDCPYAETIEVPEGGVPEIRITHGDQELVLLSSTPALQGPTTNFCQFFNVTLTNDSRTILLNDAPIFPSLTTIPNPAQIAVSLLHPDFSYTNLSAATTCSDPFCLSEKISADCVEWCANLPLGRAVLDYSYAAHLQKEEADAEIRVWDIVFDPVGARSVPAAAHSGVNSPWEFDDPERKSILIVVAGSEIKGVRKRPQRGSEDGSLFGASDNSVAYELQIVKVEQVMRRFNFSTPRLTIWGKIKRFFGGDVWKSEGELVYLSEEWGAWGKKGTLRNLVGNVFHSNFVGLFFIVVGGVIGGFLALRVVNSLWLVFKQQKGLARWEGIDAVYSQLNQDRMPEDEEGLLYQDNYEEGGSRRSLGWNDEGRSMKPLPTKPLPEKPLPQEPLIDT